MRVRRVCDEIHREIGERWRDQSVYGKRNTENKFSGLEEVFQRKRKRRSKDSSQNEGLRRDK